jgi:hypothetical protein
MSPPAKLTSVFRTQIHGRTILLLKLPGSPELEPVVAVAIVNQRAYVTFNSPPVLAGISSMFFDILRQHTY